MCIIAMFLSVFLHPRACIEDDGCLHIFNDFFICLHIDLSYALVFFSFHWENPLRKLAQLCNCGNYLVALILFSVC